MYCSSTHSSGSISVMTGCMNSRNVGTCRLLALPVRQDRLSLQAFLSLHVQESSEPALVHSTGAREEKGGVGKHARLCHAVQLSNF